MKKVISIIITFLASLILVPIIFIIFAIFNWNIIVPAIRTISTEPAYGSSRLEIFIWHMLSPFIKSIMSIQIIYNHIFSAMSGFNAVEIDFVP